MTLSGLVQKSLTPLIFINLAAMVMSGVWLLALGLLGGIWGVFLVLLVSPVIFPFLLIPAAMCAGIMRIFAVSKPVLAKVMEILSIVYLVTMLTLSVMGCFDLINDVLAIAPALIPAMIYGVTGALTPWLAFAAKDRENVFFTGLVFMTEAVAIFIMVAGAMMAWQYWTSVLLFWIILMTLVLLQILYERLFLKPATPAAPPAPPTSPA